MAGPLRGGGVRAWPLKVPFSTKLEGGGGGKALVDGPLKKTFLRLPVHMRLCASHYSMWTFHSTTPSEPVGERPHALERP